MKQKTANTPAPLKLVLATVLAFLAGCQNCDEPTTNDAGAESDPCANVLCAENAHCIEGVLGPSCICDDTFVLCDEACIPDGELCSSEDAGAITDGGSTVIDSGTTAPDAGSPHLDAGPPADSGLFCTPGARMCMGHEVHECNTEGTEFVFVESCIGDCTDDACVDPCLIQGDKLSYLGCVFWAVPLENMSLDPDDPFSVAISSNANAPVDIAITTGSGTPVQNLSLEPGALQTVELSAVSPLSGSGLTSQSYRIEANGQITVHQFNPVHEENNHSSDATLLLPVQALGLEYVGLGWPTEFFYAGFTLPCDEASDCTLSEAHFCNVDAGVCEGPVSIGKSSFSIVATADETSLVLNSPTAFEVSQGVDGGVFPASQSQLFSLEEGQVLTVQTTAIDRADMSGMRISSDKPVSVFASSSCAMVPHGTYACDHIEHQLFPSATLGNTYIGAKFHPRGTEDDMWKVLATLPNTAITTNPSIAGVDGTTLQAGDTLLFAYDGHFLISADQPISLGQYMVGSDYPGPEGGCAAMGLFPSSATDRETCDIPFASECGTNQAFGDPAFVVNVPTEQYREDYIVFTPDSYSDNYLSILVPSNGSVTLDDEPVNFDGGTLIDNTEWKVHTVLVESGVHHLEGTLPFGLMAYGYDCTVSYAYPGGLNLESIGPIQ